MIERREFTPRPWQVPMLDHLYEHERCALWAGMGVGKTAPTLTFLESLYMGGENYPTLILGPLRVARKVWPEETRKWHHLAHLDVVPVVGTQAERLKALSRDVPIKTTNYDNLLWLIEHYGDRWPFRTVIADEATRLKGHRISFRTAKKKDGTDGKEFIAGQGSKRAGALARIAHTHVRRFVELTGTPAPNGLQDLWAQAWFLDRGARLGRTFEAFKQRWFEKDYDGYGLTAREYAQPQIHAALKDLCLTIDGKDWFDLREPVVNNVYVDLSATARRLYREMEKEMFLQLDEGRTVEAFNAAAKTQKLLQLSNGAVYLDPLVENDSNPRAKDWKLVHDEKIDALKSIEAETGGSPLLVCYEFKSDLARLQKAFPHGRVLKTERDEDDFKSGKIPMLFLHPKSGGHGIDGFQNVCNNIVFFGQSWNLEEYDQVIGRIGPVRQMQAGLDRPVFVHHILTAGTVDDLVMERRTTKRAVQDILLEAMKRRK